MKNIPYNEDYPLQRVEKGDAVEISVMHLPNEFVRDKDVKKYGHIPDKKSMPGICRHGNFSAKQMPDMLFCFISLL